MIFKKLNTSKPRQGRKAYGTTYIRQNDKIFEAQLYK